MARSLSELLDTEHSAWPQVKAWLSTATNSVEVLESSARRAGQVLEAIQLATRSPLGALAFETGGVLLDHGWLRLLGSGGPRMEGDLARWNGLSARPLIDALPDAFIVAHDVLGGFFAIDQGAFGDGDGRVFYLVPDLLEWKALNGSYEAFVQFALRGDLEEFYEGFRWSDWQADVKALSPDQGFLHDPPLFEDEDGPRTRTPVSMVDLLARMLEALERAS